MVKIVKLSKTEKLSLAATWLLAACGNKMAKEVLALKKSVESAKTAPGRWVASQEYGGLIKVTDEEYAALKGVAK